ncbi:hypothetical protein Q31b_45350 [Novipirellula aureliae]|uniref:Uncharacterized protein n=1 Tax=Novipirellula aureliae TaxID=2527966 RepID=A0A5C6DRU9_9BACT|nr:hypothetical protein Q31b_45350 [Novipirellula aureliae]
MKVGLYENGFLRFTIIIPSMAVFRLRTLLTRRDGPCTVGEYWTFLTWKNEQYDFTKAWDDPINLRIVDQMPKIFNMPSEVESE